MNGQQPGGLSPARARRLARRAGRRRADGSRGLLARRAWRRLVRAGDAGDRCAVECLLQAWLRSPDEERWELLHRWVPAELAESACAGALAQLADATVGADGSSAGTSPLTAFCAARALTPADPVRRAVFLLLTGEHSQYRAADPDGSLLAQGYMAATDAERRGLRAAMADASGLDLVRVVLRANRPDQVTPPTTDEISYLTGQLAGRRDWPGLWRLVTNLPVLDAAGAMRLFEQRWRPADDRDHVLFGALTRADPGQLARGLAELPDAAASQTATGTPPGSTMVTATIDAPGLRRYRQPDIRYHLYGRALSASARRLAMVMPEHRGDGECVLNVFDLRSGSLAEQYRLDCPSSNVRLTFAGDALIASRYDRDGLWRYYAGRVTPLPWPGTRRSRFVDALGPSPALPAGFLVLSHDELVQFDSRGAVASSHGIAHLLRGGDDDGHSNYRTQPVHLAVHPGGRAAVACDRDFAVFDVAGAKRRSRIARANQPPELREIFFTGPDRLLTIAYAGKDGYMDVSELRLWRLAGWRLELEATRRTPYADDPIMIPGHDELACWMLGEVRYLDAATLADAPAPSGFATGPVRGLWNSPGYGACALARDDGVIEVHMTLPPAAVLAARPPARWVPGDLATVTGARTALPPDSASRPLLDLLSACLEHRFATDAAIGDPSAATPEDIALADDDQS